MNLQFLTSGESHGLGLLAILDGFPAGLPLSISDFKTDMTRRRLGMGSGLRMKIEDDTVHIISGVMEGFTTGAPIGLYISNADHKEWRNTAIPPFTIPRPGHADLAGVIKFGINDLRPVSERASARETAARVAVGVVCRKLLAQFGIGIAGWVSAIGSISADLHSLSISTCISQAAKSKVNCPDPSSSEAMQSLISTTAKSGDTLGGVIDIVAIGVPPGLGSFSQWDSRLDSRLGAAILSIPGIKGVEIGKAFANSRLPGTCVQDPIIKDPDGNLSRSTNNAGGIEGGISNGEPILLHAAMKPIPSTLASQNSVDLAQGEIKQTTYERADICPVPRAVVILESMTAYVISDALIKKLGGDSIDEMTPRFAALHHAKLQDLNLTKNEHYFWTEDL